MKNKTFLAFLTFGCIGLTSEICFTAVTETIEAFGTSEFNLRLMGHTYIWMFPIYGLIAFIGPLLLDKIQHLNIFFRLLIYAGCIYVIEFFTGWLLCKFTGSCPWEYKVGWHFFGYIRLDYLPAWMFFGWMIERIYLFVMPIINQHKA